MDTQIMRFNDFRFKPGLQTTIRRGPKWAAASGTVVGVTDTPGLLKGRISVGRTAVKRFYQLDTGEIDAWHLGQFSDGMRAFSRMFAISEYLERCYRMPLFDARELVSVVWFEVAELHGKTGDVLAAMLAGESR